MQAAVDGDDLSGDVAGGVGGQEADDGGDFIGLSETLHGDHGFDDFLDLVGQDVGHIGGDESGGDTIDGDPAFGKFLGRRLGQADQAGLGGRIVALAGIAHDTGDAGDLRSGGRDPHPPARQVRNRQEKK